MARKTKSTRAHPQEEALPESAAARIALWLENPNETDLDRINYYKVKFGHRTRILDLSDLGLRKLPEKIRDISNLENIDLSYNNLESLPDWITELRELRKL